MLYMLDTNICIYLMKRRPISYFEKLESLQQTNTIAISSIVLSELQYGVANSQHQEQSQITLNMLLSKLDVMPYTEQCAFYYGQIRSLLKNTGRMIGGNDLFIASHAMAESATLVTNNSSEFERIPQLLINNWDKHE